MQLMKPFPKLGALLDKAKSKRIFGTKMRSVIKQADPAGVENIVRQQFEWAAQIIAAGLVPIIEPEVDIHCPKKSAAESLLKAGILAKLNQLPAGQVVMLKLTLPDQPDLYADFVKHPRLCGSWHSGRLLAGRSQQVVRKNHGVVASFLAPWSKG